MRYHKHIKDILHGADDQTAAEIAEMTDAADEKTKERIYAMTCERLAQKNGAAETNGESFRVAVTRRPSWMRSAAAAAACLVIAGGLTGGAVMLHRSAQSTPTPEFAEQTIDEQTTTAETQLKIQKELSVVKIIDRAKEEGLPFDEALEKIHEDEENEYFLSGIYSHYVIVHYSDGTQEDIKSALQSGRATMTDMDRFGIHYWTEPKETTEPPTKTTEETNASQTGLCSDPLQSTTTIGETSSPVCSDPLQSTTTTTTTTETYYPVCSHPLQSTTTTTGETTFPVCSHPLQSTTTKPLNPSTNVMIVKIVDRTKEEELTVADALEKIHEDNENEYYLPAIYSHYVIVHYSDGTQEDIKSALKNGRVKISDLDRFGIHYYTEQKVPTTPTLKPEQEQALEALREEGRKMVGEFTRQEKIILGEIPADSARLTYEKANEIIGNADNLDEVIEKFNRIHKFPDFIGGSGVTIIEYWLDDTGYEKFLMIHEQSDIFHVKGSQRELLFTEIRD